VDKRQRNLGWVTAIGLGLLVLLAVIFSRPSAEGQLIWGGMLRLDSAGFIFRLLFLSGAALTALFAAPSEGLAERGEFFALMLVSTLGMSLMASAGDLITLYLAIETTSLPLYILAGFLTRDQRSTEAGVKYLLFGAVTSAVMLYGFSLLFGFTGTTKLYELSSLLSAGAVSKGLLVVVIGLVLTGFAFKISAAPFHFWAPDVYQGAPTPVAGFLSTASKAAGFVALMRVLMVIFPVQSALWTIIMGVLATASMLIGNYLALAQKSLKRLLAYSSIAQAGYMMIGIAAGTQLGTLGAVYYLMAYLVTNLAAFAVAALVEQRVGSDEISSFAGLSRRSPGIALALLVALLSLGGVPPFGGFFAKLLVFGSAIEANMLWLALVGIFNAIIGLYYYLNVLKVVYLSRSDDESPLKSVGLSWRVGLVICIVGVLLLGVIYSPFYTAALQTATALIP
jgi:NADH-quinone oxidoreductase subunit N